MDKSNAKTIAAIILAVMAIPLSFGVGTVVAPPTQLLTAAPIIIMSACTISGFLFARWLWGGNKIFGLFGSGLLFITGFVCLWTIPPGPSAGNVVMLALLIGGALLTIKFQRMF